MEATRSDRYLQLIRQIRIAYEETKAYTAIKGILKYGPQHKPYAYNPLARELFFIQFLKINGYEGDGSLLWNARISILPSTRLVLRIC